jgi:V8-like Glu-specific endopeptidase
MSTLLTQSLRSLPLALSIALLLPTLSHSSPDAPSLTLANDAAIDDRPTSTDPAIPTTLTTEQTLPTPPTPRTRGIVCGPNSTAANCDKRTPMKSRNYPWSAIGRLQIGDSSHCTATLIDESWILTNAHCVVDRKTHKIIPEPLSFLPNLIDKQLKLDTDRARVTKIIIGTDFRESNIIPHPQDWAMLKLDKPLGKTYGTIGWKAIPSALLIKNAEKYTLAGYSFDFPSRRRYPEFSAGPGYTAGVHQSCSITGEQRDRVLIHNCHTRAGSSGSAIITWIKDKPYIVAINNAERTNSKTGFGTENYAVNVTRVNDWFVKQQR